MSFSWFLLNFEATACWRAETLSFLCTAGVFRKLCDPSNTGWDISLKTKRFKVMRIHSFHDRSHAKNTKQSWRQKHKASLDQRDSVSQAAWMRKQIFISIPPTSSEIFQSRSEFCDYQLIEGLSRNLFPGSCTPLHSLINMTLTTLMSAMQPHIRSQSTCTGLNIC